MGIRAVRGTEKFTNMRPKKFGPVNCEATPEWSANIRAAFSSKSIANSRPFRPWTTLGVRERHAII